jgi:DNA transformation protein
LNKNHLHTTPFQITAADRRPWSAPSLGVKFKRNEKMSDLSQHINIGKDTESKLNLVGIRSYSELVALGAEQAFIRLQVIDPGACLSLLYGLQGSIDDVPWHKLPEDKKMALKSFYKLAKKNQNLHLTTAKTDPS